MTLGCGGGGGAHNPSGTAGRDRGCRRPRGRWRRHRRCGWRRGTRGRRRCHRRRGRRGWTRGPQRRRGRRRRRGRCRAGPGARHERRDDPGSASDDERDAGASPRNRSRGRRDAVLPARALRSAGDRHQVVLLADPQRGDLRPHSPDRSAVRSLRPPSAGRLPGGRGRAPASRLPTAPRGRAGRRHRLPRLLHDPKRRARRSRRGAARRLPRPRLPRRARCVSARPSAPPTPTSTRRSCAPL